VLENTKNELADIERTTAAAIESLAETFRSLAAQADTILALTGDIVAYVEKESFSALLPTLHALSSTTRNFIGDRVRATSGILETVTSEVELLQKLLQITRGQEGIAQQTKALTVLTNVEVARLGEGGEGFQYLARELAGFSKSVTRGTEELERQTRDHLKGIVGTQRTLATEQPRLREDFAHMELDLSETLATVESSLARLAQTPAQFRGSAQQVAQQIGGVVTAIQSHDITRQQIEHVQESLTLISTLTAGDALHTAEALPERGKAYAGLAIQIQQLQSSMETVARWVGQIHTCMHDILEVSASEVAGIGSLVLNNERELAAQLAQLERLDHESRAHSKRIQESLGGLASLMHLFRDHVNKSNTNRDSLRLLTFNSIIEGGRVGSRAAAILAIADVIKEISADWSVSTDQSEQTMQQVANLTARANALMEPFSASSEERLGEARTETALSLDTLRTAATVAARQAQETQLATERMQAGASAVGQYVTILQGCCDRISAVLAKMERVRQQWETEQPNVKDHYDPAEIEQLFGASYTTERERAILHAVLDGAALPVEQQGDQGNEVELF